MSGVITHLYMLKVSTYFQKYAVTIALVPILLAINTVNTLRDRPRVSLEIATN